MKLQQRKMPAKKPKVNTVNQDTITIAGGSDFDYNWLDTAIGDINLSNYTIDTSGINTVNWGQNYSITTPIDNSVNITNDGLDMAEDCDIKIGDRSLKQFMDRVDEQLAILHPAVELEERWNKLKQLRAEYERVKEEILEKEKLMKILKDNG